MNNLAKVWKYYTRKDVQDALLEISRKREIVGVYDNGSFDKRPNIFAYPDDIVEMVKKGVVSFHGSVEKWSNPMSLESGMTAQQLDKLRIGWDLIIDPDCPDFELSKITVKTICEALEDHGIKNYSIKYTGGKSFHIGVPFESFPKKVNTRKTEELYPNAAKTIIEYLKDYTRDTLKERFLELDNPLALAERVGKNITDCIDEEGINPLKLVEIDSMVASSRHMFRLPYSLHEKSLLVSLPLKLEQLDKFQKEDASPWKVKLDTKFFEKKPELAEASALLVEALDWSKKYQEEDKEEYKGPKRQLKKVPKKYFPPCIHKILQGVPDGRKRSVFVLTTFLQNMGWSWDKIEKELEAWNQRNPKPLPKNYIKTQLRWHQRQPRNLLPPNCNNENYYKNIIGEVKDDYCGGLKNPVNYVFKKLKRKK
ncbi:MAG: hypothetical protein ISS48_04455 [Candidatus Aenigmarchaeota archaeon]|nr:hypothetical protein [Candidatus Aenigmarchaeota archaeon]